MEISAFPSVLRGTKDTFDCPDAWDCNFQLLNQEANLVIVNSYLCCLNLKERSESLVHILFPLDLFISFCICYSFIKLGLGEENFMFDFLLLDFLSLIKYLDFLLVNYLWD